MRAKIQVKEKVQQFVHKEVRKLFVGGIPPPATFQEFRSYFEQFGEIEDALLPPKQDGSSHNNGFGFVTFKRPSDARAVLNHPKNHTIRAKWVSLGD